MANEIGKRCVCTKCGAEFVITGDGDGAISCCGQPMAIKE